jgi:very-short-patch-repair endonuclease
VRLDAEARLQTLRVAEEIFPELDDVDRRRVSAGKALFRAAWSDRLSSKAGSLKDAADRYFDHVERWRGGGRKNKEFFDGYRQSAQAVLGGLPIWITTNLSVGAAVPFEPGLFDCVVIDEASQCDLASVLPLLFRAKRAVFVGDPKQLRHIPGITPDQETYVANKTDASDLLVDFAPISRSAYDLAASDAVARGDSELLLSQHYRCHPDIIGFSNMAFYADRLVARTSGATVSGGFQAGMSWQHVDGTLLRTAKSATNETEAQAVVSLIQSVLEQLRAGGTTVGVVTPFRSQADLILKMLSAQSWWSYHGQRVTVGTAHAFQGSECDVMIFSPVVTKGMKESLVRFAAHSDELLNVAVTRARAALYVVGDAASCRAAGGALKELVDYARQLADRKTGRPTPRSAAETAFARILDRLGFEYREEVPLYRHKDQAPYRLDFVYVAASGIRYDLEVDGGTHSENNRFQEDAVRDKIAEAAGYTVIRIPAVDVLNSPEVAAERLRRLT